MVLKRELARDEHELIAPMVEVTGVDIEHDGNMVPDVVDGDRWAWSCRRATASCCREIRGRRREIKGRRRYTSPRGS